MFSTGYYASKLFGNAELRRFVLFLCIGSINFAFYYIIFTALHLLGATPSAGVVIATVIGVLFNFCTTGRLVFQSNTSRVLPRFIGVYVAQCALNVSFLKLLMIIGIPVLLAEAMVVGGLAVFTFLALRRWVFEPSTVSGRKTHGKDPH